MSYQQERRFVLDMLETGKISLDQATRLLDLLSLPQSPNVVLDKKHNSPNHIYLEVDADQKDIHLVLDKLNQAFSRI